MSALSDEMGQLTRDELDRVARRAGLRLTEKDLVGLAAVEKQLRTRLERVRDGLAWADEPATIFVPPAGDPGVKP